MLVVSSFTITQPSCAGLQINSCCPAAPLVCSSICPSTQAFGLPELGGTVLVVCTGKVFAADRSTLFVKVLVPPKLLSPLNVSLPLNVCGCVRMSVLVDASPASAWALAAPRVAASA